MTGTSHSGWARLRHEVSKRCYAAKASVFDGSAVWAHRISVWSVVALFGGLVAYVVCVWP